LNQTVETLERASAGLSDKFVVKSKVLRDDFIARGIGTPEQHELIYHGVDIDKYAPAAEQPRATDRPVLLYVGRLADGKGLFDLLDVFERLSACHDVKLRIVGDGPLLSDLRRAVEIRGLDDVTLCGYVEDVAAELATADIFVLPSYREGTPRVITEALAVGVPVVSTAIAGIPDQVSDGESGLLVEPGDRDALEVALSRLVESPDQRRQMGRTARETVSKFAIEMADEQYRALYDRLSESCSP
jgi:glycosyltransferase involved in cell wall biosynthesis